MADLATTLGLSGGETLAWGGDSITAAQMSAIYEACWFQLFYPSLDCPTYVIARSGSSLEGWATPPPVATSGDSSIGLWERYHAPIAPDVCFIMHGQNGGDTPAEHIAFYQGLWDDWIEPTGAKLVMLGMHPVQTTSDTKSAEGKADEEATWAATDARLFSSHTFDWMGSEWIANGNNAIDMQQHGAEPFTTSGAVENDSTSRVHPGPAGHIVIAWAHLKGLDVDTLVSSATIAANTNTTTASDQCTISNLSMTANGGTFDRLDARLPWAIDEAGRANAVALIPAIANWQEYSITFTGLAAGSYHLKCDGVTLGTYTDVEFAAGINMADFTSGPIWEQGQEVLGCFRDLSGYNRTNGNIISPAPVGSIERYDSSTTSHYQNGDLRGTDYTTAMATVAGQLATLMAPVFTAAQPVTRTWAIESVSGAAPTIDITTPASPPTVAEGTPITFEADATDAEDGDLTAAITWESDISGALGTGGSINPTLAAGFHTITARVVDSNDNEAFTQTNATVEAAPQITLTVTTATFATMIVG